ncbi:hypothetical protein [uncultured Thiodictyon sp.]|uniref:hypothetical protein n=1 Tax=uncultured Thiodictyon sp. TaxID=1846217 RepID=UPI0025EF388F|nr:hypothetical protein [uncultured Thiodictyon sp.]
MAYDDFSLDGHGKVVASKAINKVVSNIRSVWEQVFNEPMEIRGSSPTDRFRSVLEQLESALRRDDKGRITEVLDMDESKSVIDIIEELAEPDVQLVTDVSDLTPNQIKQAIYEVARRLGNDEEKVDVNMQVFLRKTLDQVFETALLKGRINVGENRHFPRLLQWLMECEEETDWGDSQGIHILNAALSGRVARNPTNPSKLLVRIDRSYL